MVTVKDGATQFEHTIELYEARGTRSDRVLWATHELGLEDKVTLHTYSFSDDASNLKALNPMKQVPTMVLTAPDGSKITASESAGSVATLAEACGRLTPAVDNVFGRSQYYRMLSFAASEVDNAVTTVFFNFKYAIEKQPEREAEARKKFDEKVSKVIEEILDNNGSPVEWICEPYHEGFTAADIVLGWSLWLGSMVGMLEGKPVLQAYLDRLTQREAWMKIRAKK